MTAVTGLVASGVALLVSAGATWLVRAGARRFGFVARPNPIVPQHTGSVAHLGGLGVAAGLGAGLVAAAAATPDGFAAGMVVPGFVAGTLGFLAVGTLDDLSALHAAPKLAAQAAVAAGAVLLGVWVPLTGFAAVDQGLALLWILTVVNACNVTDVCDGLLSGLTVVAMLLMASALSGTAPVALACAGACAGFLVFNRPPATIFLGDAGSHLLGFVSAALALNAAATAASPAAATLAGALWMGVPLFELLFVTAVRVRKGLPWWSGSADHFALRLQARGLSRLQASLVASVAAGACGLGALVVVRAGGLVVSLVIGLAAATGGAMAARLLLRWEVGDGRGGPRLLDDRSPEAILEGAGS